jgi:tryptophan 2,3-dioxygenase
MKPYPPISYNDYLQTDKLLSLQKKRSDQFKASAHDEMLFIIIHQTYELWFKQILTELDSVISVFSTPKMDEAQMGMAVARLQRITEIQKLLVSQVTVLETMTPLDFLDFREFLYPASGFQSAQFRLIENRLGLKSETRLPFNALPYTAALSEKERAEIVKSETEPSLSDLVEAWLERMPFLESDGFAFWDLYRKAVENMLNQDRETVSGNSTLSTEISERNLKEIDSIQAGFNALFDQKAFDELRAQGAWRMSYRAVHAALLTHLYRDQPILQLPFRLLTVLQDIDELLTTWRYRHALMAQRMLGSKIGTGGSSGHRYLRAATDKHRVFGDFANLATFLIPRSKLPELPEEIKKRLGFFYSHPVV